MSVTGALSKETIALSKDFSDGKIHSILSNELTSIQRNAVMGRRDNNSVFIYDLSSETIKLLPGKFKALNLGVNLKNYALTPSNEIYFLKNPIWTKVKTNNRVDNFTVGTNFIYYQARGIWYVKSLANNQEEKLKLATNKPQPRYINKINGKTYIILDNENNLSTVFNKKKTLIFQNVKNIHQLRNELILFSDFEHNVYLHTFNNNRSIKVWNDKKHHSLFLSHENIFISATKNAIQTSSQSLERKLGVFKEITFTPKRTSYTASQLFSGGGILIRKSETGNYSIWNENNFSPISGKPIDISINNLQKIWFNNAFGHLFKTEKNKARQFQYSVKHISATNGHVLIINHQNDLMRYNKVTKNFIKVGRKADRVFSENYNTYWIQSKKGDTLRCSNRCKKIKEKIVKFSISPRGLLLAINTEGHLLSWYRNKFKKHATKLKNITDIAIQNENLLWILDEKYKLHQVKIGYRDKTLSNQFKDIFLDQSILINFNTQLKNNKFLINNNLISSSQAKLTAAAPNIKLKSKSLKKLKIKTINFDKTLFDISMGRDGVLWALTSNKLFQFHEKEKKLKLYNNANFRDRRQKFLGLPENITASSIISDKYGKIWMVKKDAKTVFYQRKFEGNFHSTKVRSSDNITDITVDIFGNVYVAAKDIYQFDYRKKKFKKLKLKKGKYDRISSAVKGSLWLVNDKGELFERLGGKLFLRNRKSQFKAQDVDMSVNGEVYVTSNTHKTRTNEQGNNATANPLSDLECNLERYNPEFNKLERTGKNTGGNAQYVAVSVDGTPWVTCAPSGSQNIFRAE
jgi:hypothetical protein